MDPVEGIQAKLEEYRLRKRRQERFVNLKEKVKSFIMMGTGSNEASSSNEVEPKEPHTKVEMQVEKAQKSKRTPSVCSSENEELLSSIDENEVVDVANTELRQENQVFKYIQKILLFLFWVTLYVIAIELKFGIVFLMISALVGIYLNTRTTPKKANELSAYSVFNENCESIDGTLKAEHFERQLFYQPPKQ